jgi:hypothetical protein
MAIVHITLAGASAHSVNGVQMPVLDSVPVAVDTITSIATAATAGISSPAGSSGLVWNVASDTACYVTFNGSTPGPEAGYFVNAGSSIDRAALPGQTPKVIAA